MAQCHYNQATILLFDECFDQIFENYIDPEDFNHALAHSDMFQGMVGALTDREIDPEAVLADAIRIGMEMGKRKNEIEKLEAMVELGIEPKPQTKGEKHVKSVLRQRAKRTGRRSVRRLR